MKTKQSVFTKHPIAFALLVAFAFVMGLPWLVVYATKYADWVFGLAKCAS